MADRSSTEATGLRPSGRRLTAAHQDGGGGERTGITRSAIIAEARSWIGTPYHHQASVKGGGCDCLGLVRGVWRSLLGPEPEAIPGYSRDWGEIGAQETMLAAARRHLIEIDPRSALAGDVLVFRMRRGRMAKHAGILSGIDWHMADGLARFIHAQEGGAACEVALSPWWQARIAAAFAFPGLPVSAGADPMRLNEKD